MEPDEKHEPQYEPDRGLDMVDWEAQNTDWLTEKFMLKKDVQKLWEEFVCDEYNNQAPPEDREER